MTLHPLLNCRKCGSSQVDIIPLGLIDYHSYKVKIVCLSCRYTRTSTMAIPHEAWDTAEQNKEGDFVPEESDTVLDYDAVIEE